jgi:hypothetical protein
VGGGSEEWSALYPFHFSSAKLIPCPVTTFSALPSLPPHPCPCSDVNPLKKKLYWFCVHTGLYGCISPSLPVYPRSVSLTLVSEHGLSLSPTIPHYCAYHKACQLLSFPLHCAYTACVGAELWAGV